MTLIDRERATEVLESVPSRELEAAPAPITEQHTESAPTAEVDPATARDASAHTLEAATAFADKLMERYDQELQKLDATHESVVADFVPRYNLARGLREVSHTFLVLFDRNIAATIEVRRDYGKAADEIEVMAEVRCELVEQLAPVAAERDRVEAKANACQHEMFTLQRQIDEERGPTPRGDDLPSVTEDAELQEDDAEDEQSPQQPEQSPSRAETDEELQLAALRTSYGRLTARHGQLSQQAADLAGKLTKLDQQIAMRQGFQQDRRNRLDLFVQTFYPQYLAFAKKLRETAAFIQSDQVALTQRDTGTKQLLGAIKEHTRELASMLFPEADFVTTILPAEKRAAREQRFIDNRRPGYTMIPGLAEEEPELMHVLTDSVQTVYKMQRFKLNEYDRYDHGYSDIEDIYTEEYEALRERRTIERDEFKDGADIAKQNLANAVAQYDSVCRDVARLGRIGNVFDARMAALLPEFTELRQQASAVGNIHEGLRSDRDDVEGRLQQLRAAIATMSSDAKVALAEQRHRQAQELAQFPPADEQGWDAVGRILGDSSYFDPIVRQLNSADLFALGFGKQSNDMAQLETDETNNAAQLAKLGNTMVFSLAIRDELRSDLADVAVAMHEARQFFDTYQTHATAAIASARVGADLERRLAERWLDNHRLWPAFRQEWTKEIDAAPPAPSEPAEYRQPVPVDPASPMFLRRAVNRIMQSMPRRTKQLEGGTN